MSSSRGRLDVLSYAPKLARFGAVGLINGALYAAATSVSVQVLGLSATSSSAIGYLFAIPFAFLAHRSFTFRSRVCVWRQARRFALVHGTSLAVSVGAMAGAVHLLGLNFVAGIVAALVLVPAVTFVVFDLWVFPTQKADASIHSASKDLR